MNAELTHYLGREPYVRVNGNVNPDFDSKCGFSQKNINNINESVREFQKCSEQNSLLI